MFFLPGDTGWRLTGPPPSEGYVHGEDRWLSLLHMWSSFSAGVRQSGRATTVAAAALPPTMPQPDQGIFLGMR